MHQHRLTGHNTITLHVITTQHQPACDSTMTCPCANCIRERTRLVHRGVRTSPTLGIPIRKAA